MGRQDERSTAPSIASRWDLLARQAAEPNPFLESWYLLPALRALDPDGTLWDEARRRGIVMPGDEINSLGELALDCEQRVKAAPFLEAKDEFRAFRGGAGKGYDVISRSALRKINRNEDGTENESSEWMSMFA